MNNAPFYGKVLRDPDHKPDSLLESQRWDWFEVSPDSFALGSSWEDVHAYYDAEPKGVDTEEDIRESYGPLTDVTDQYPNDGETA